MNGKKRLVAARPEVDEGAGYLPRIPWPWVLTFVLVLGTVTGGYWLKEHRKALQLRASIVRVHEQQLGPARDAYSKLRGKLDALITGAAKGPRDTFVDPRLKLGGLRSGAGLYLRLPSSDALDVDGVARAAKVMEPDSIASCLGLLPTSARGLYERGEFLLPSWLKPVKGETSVMKLRVHDEVLSRRIRSDLPSVLGLLRSDWFLLVLQTGKDRRDYPVDVFLWDLRSAQQLLRARVQAQGLLVAARVLSKDAPASPRADPEQQNRAGRSDCLIASALKALTAAPRP